MKDRSLLDHIAQDVLGNPFELRIRAMFGGYGLYWDGAIFGIFDDGELFLKVDDTIRPDFEARGCRPFSYPSKHGEMTMNGYWTAPEDILESRADLLPWIQRSAALSSKKKV